VKAGIEQAIARGSCVCAVCRPAVVRDRQARPREAKHFAEGIRKKFPGKLLAYNCSPSFNWKRKLDDASIAKFQRELGAMGYKFQFITLAGFHALNYSMFELARGYKAQQMTAYVALQQAEFAAESNGYTATKHQREVARAISTPYPDGHGRKLLDHCPGRQHRGAAVPRVDEANEGIWLARPEQNARADLERRRYANAPKAPHCGARQKPRFLPRAIGVVRANCPQAHLRHQISVRRCCRSGSGATFLGAPPRSPR